MNFKECIKTVKAFQWFPGMEAPWTIEKSGDHYFVLHLGDRHDYGTYGPLTIDPGDYIIFSKEIKSPDKVVESYSWMSKKHFEEIFEDK